MAFHKDTYCQICENFVTKEQRKMHLYCSRRLRKDVKGYWPDYLSTKKFTTDEISRLEKAFREMVFGSESALSMYGFLKT